MKKAIIAERLLRQHLSIPISNPEDYIELFRLLQPVSPIFFSYPGSPPRLVHRTAFDDSKVADRMREDRAIVKGRFLGGNIGYVLSDDLEIYANAFCRQIPLISDIQQRIFDTIRYTGPLTPRQIKEETGLLNKQIAPALSRLQEAFLVYEDQPDDNWARGWYEFATEWREVCIDESKKERAISQVLLNFLQGHVFATMEQIKDWSQLSSKLLTAVINDMEKNRKIVSRLIEGLGEGWMLPQDISGREVKPSVFMLHRSDFLARSHASELKRRFGDYEVLQYLLIDGEFKGAVVGHWRIGPYDVDDIILELPHAERAQRRDEIIRAVSWYYKKPDNPILKYDGKEIEKETKLKAF